MTGGLINIVAYGSQDLFLTGTPQITYFKVVYRRHTNFSMESFQLPFDDEVGFGLTSNIRLPTIGDLAHKTYLHVVLPEVYFTRKINSSQISQQQTIYNDAFADLKIVMDFMSINIEAYRSAIEVFSAYNAIGVESMFEAILNTFNITSGKANQTNINIVNNFEDLINSYPQYSLRRASLFIIATELSDINAVPTNKTAFVSVLNDVVTYCTKLQDYFQKKVTIESNKLDDVSSENYKFAWVDKIGHSIIDYVEVLIGGEQIDRQYGDWMNIWYELTSNRNMEDSYMKMIGNVPKLTTFDRDIKSKYDLFIPLQFWFCRHNGLAIPLVAIEYHDVTISIKLKNVEDCCYHENTGESINLSDLFEDYNYGIEASLLVDYIYLDGPERKKFAQGAHEYLIEQSQMMSIENVDQQKVQIKLDFNNPCKEMIWVMQKDSYIQNNDGFTKCRWDNYSISKAGMGNPLISAKMEFNGYSRFNEYGGNYFNYIQPYSYHRNTPADGINIYSFCLSPEEHQPSGTCNFTRIGRAVLYLTLNELMFEYSHLDKTDEIIVDDTAETNIETTIMIRIYTTAYNILRIINGMGAVAYSR
jgi:hypothetical protein